MKEKLFIGVYAGLSVLVYVYQPLVHFILYKKLLLIEDVLNYSLSNTFSRRFTCDGGIKRLNNSF